MIHKRYTDELHLIMDADELKLTNGTQVVIYHEDKWHDEIAVDLEGKASEFEELKPYILFITKNLSKMDGMAQKYCALGGDSKFADGYEVAYILLGAAGEIRLGYYGTRENTEFDVVFQCVNGELILKSFGMVNHIPPDWDKE